MNTLKPVLLLLVVLSFPTNVLMAQQDRKDEQLLKVYEFKNVDSNHAKSVFDTMFDGDKGVRMSITERRLTVLGNQAIHKKTENLLALLDKAPAKAVLPTPTVIYMEHVEATEMLNVVSGLTRNLRGEFRMSVDTRMNALIVAADDNLTKHIQNIVAKLDVATPVRALKVDKQMPKNCKVRISWLVDAEAMSDEDQEKLRQPRASLQPLIKQLKKDEAISKAATLTEVQSRVQAAAPSERAKKFSNASFRVINKAAVHINGGGTVTRQSDKRYNIDLSFNFEFNGRALRVNSDFSAPVDHPVTSETLNATG